MISTSLSNTSQRIFNAATAVSRLVVPSTCIACGRFVASDGGCCASCWSKMRFIRKPICPVMGTPFSVDMGDNFLCAEAIADPPPFDRLRAVMLYDDIARSLVSSFKYADRLDIAKTLARWMEHAAAELVEDADLVVSVPLHPSRLRQRRFNQSAELARLIAGNSGKRYRPSCLIRRRPTRQQVGLTERERATNVSGAFAVPAEHKIEVKGQRILLVDDVYTSGATTKAAARALKRGGAGNIDVLVFAKVETADL